MPDNKTLVCAYGQQNFQERSKGKQKEKSGEHISLWPTTRGWDDQCIETGDCLWFLGKRLTGQCSFKEKSKKACTNNKHTRYQVSETQWQQKFTRFNKKTKQLTQFNFATNFTCKQITLKVGKGIILYNIIFKAYLSNWPNKCYSMCVCSYSSLCISLWMCVVEWEQGQKLIGQFWWLTGQNLQVTGPSISDL